MADHRLGPSPGLGLRLSSDAQKSSPLKSQSVMPRPIPRASGPVLKLRAESRTKGEAARLESGVWSLEPCARLWGCCVEMDRLVGAKG